jgi:hypothetical protein
MKQYDINQLSEISLKFLKKNNFYLKLYGENIDFAIRSHTKSGFKTIEHAINAVETDWEEGICFEVLDHQLNVVHTATVRKQNKNIKKPNTFIQWLRE